MPAPYLRVAPRGRLFRGAASKCVLALLAIAVLRCGNAPAARPGECGGCHARIETASSSHAGCVSCHGGDPSARVAAGAHRSIHERAGLAAAERWQRACGACHADQVGRMTSSQMFTNAGMIAQIRATWEGAGRGVPYGAIASEQWGPGGTRIEHASIADADDLSGELYRKFCSRCHLARPNDDPDQQGHATGCAVCHFPQGGDATYRGADAEMRGRSPHSATHTLQGLPPMEVCASCHDRSGRMALSYRGLQDGNNALVPTRGGMPGPVGGSDGRSFTHIAPDVHFEAGMECIDCHTSREVMGDGYAHASMEGQVEIRCEDCHGDALRPPRTAVVSRESDPALRESRQYARPLTPGARVALTSKGRPYANVFEQNGTLMLATKRGGKLLRSKVITGTPEHTIAGHERLECATCHSRAVPQCYGCHTKYDKRESSWDFVKDEDTPGAFEETEDYRTLYPFPLALNGRGGIAPVTPGCQTFVTVVEEDGNLSKRDEVLRYGGRPQLRFAPFYSHNTGSRAVGCAECHANPAFLGFGQHVIEEGAIRSTMLCERNPKKGLDAFLAIDGDAVVSHAAIARDGARPFAGGEIRSILAVNLCLDCHPRADDPIYRKELDYEALDDALHRRLLDRR